MVPLVQGVNTLVERELDAPLHAFMGSVSTHLLPAFAVLETASSALTRKELSTLRAAEAGVKSALKLLDAGLASGDWSQLIEAADDKHVQSRVRSAMGASRWRVWR